MLVEEGIFENTLELGPKIERQILEVGQVLSTPIAARHEMKCLSEQGRTLHVYTPRIQERTEAGRFASGSLAELTETIKVGEETSLLALRRALSEVRSRSLTTSSPYFMNQLFSGLMPQNLMAEELIAQTRTTMATIEASPVFSKIESQLVESLGEIIGWEVGSRDGVCVPGGSAANFMALHCARQKKFPEMKKRGIAGKILKVFVSQEAHYSFKKACMALGLGTDHLVSVAVDAHGKMIPHELEAKIEACIKNGETPLLVSATSGTTVLGSFDPIDEISQVCRKHGVWLHVDAAWGGPALFSEKLKDLMSGSELADSLTFDAHKLFGAGLTCSFILTKHVGLLLEANDVSGGDYLFHASDESIDRGKMTWQCGRRADALSFWTIWKSLGTQGLGSFVDRLTSVRDEALAWIQTQERIELVSSPEYLNLCVRIKPPRPELDKADWSRQVREGLKDKNIAMVNYSTNEQGHFLRLILANPELELKHVQQILQWSLEQE